MDENDKVKGEAEILSCALLRPLDHDEDHMQVETEYLELWSKFTRPSPPHITLTDYVARLMRLLKLDDTVCLAVIRYKHILHDKRGIQVDESCAHRFVLAATVVASKCMLDSQFAFPYYARAGGVSTRELAALEVSLLCLLDWHLHECAT